MGLEGDAILIDLAVMAEAEDLEAAAIGEHRTAPAYEAMQAAELLYEVGAGAQVEMISVAQDDSGLEGFQFVRRDRFDAGLGAHGHEHGGFEVAVRGGEDAGTGHSEWGVAGSG